MKENFGKPTNTKDIHEDSMLKVAILYDFDGTLAPGNMQEHSFIPNLGMSRDAFWAEVSKFRDDNCCEETLAYMYLMLRKAREEGIVLSKKYLEGLGRSINLFPGVIDWFKRINDFACAFDIEVEHYILSSGNKEIIEGTRIAKHFKKIYASTFLFDEHGVAQSPSYNVSFTTKTQFLFRIEKRALEEKEVRLLNSFVTDDHIHIPFSRMVFIGDGVTDVPCMKLVKDRGGYSIAVYNPSVDDPNEQQKILNQANKLIEEKRISFVSPADYSKNKELQRYVEIILQTIALNHEMNVLNNTNKEALDERRRQHEKD